MEKPLLFRLLNTLNKKYKEEEVMVNVSKIIAEEEKKSKADYDFLEKLMMKYELNKKLYKAYDTHFSEPVSKKEVSRNEYCQIAKKFCLEAKKINDIRFYNTALKIADKIHIELPEIK